jgi:integrase
MRALCKPAGVKPFGFHAIRHLTASILAQADVPMVTIQRILRHKNLTTTERYISGLEPVRPALEILSNRNSRSRFTTTREALKTKETEAM